jgi:CRP/FNR family transcriptional regulator, cyclic AMP receptor protein
MATGALGKTYADGELIVREGAPGDSMYFIQAGHVDVLHERDGQEVHLTTLGEGDIFGEIALFQQEVRSATVRARGEVRLLTLDKRAFLRRVHEDPSLAYRMLQKMSNRIRELSSELARLKTSRAP